MKRWPRRAGVAIAIVSAAALWRARCGGGGGDVDDVWRARSELVYYDHLERVELGDGEGRASWGREQNVHFTSRLAYTRDGDALVLRYLDPPAAGVTREVTFTLARGEYRFERTTPVGRETTLCRRRISFDATPFPSDLAPATQYFAACARE